MHTREAWQFTLCMLVFLPLAATNGGECAAAQSTQGGAAQSRPNVVWLVLDACRADHLSCYGYHRDTSPNIDKLAQRGVLFEQDYSQAPNTVPSVPSYLTGKYFPVQCLSVGDWRDQAKVPPPDERLVSDVLRQQGYTTFLVSASPWLSPDTRLFKTFDVGRFVPPTEGRAYAEFEELEPVIHELLEERGDAPFFLHVHAMDTHTPHYQSERRTEWFPDGRIDARPERPFSKEGQDWLQAEYDSSVAYADSRVGELLAFLHSQKLDDETIVIISADHGELLGEDGETLEHFSTGQVDELYHTPLIMAGPGVPREKRVSALTENVDIVPTVNDLVAAPQLSGMDGRSLLPLSSGIPPEFSRQFIFAARHRCS